MKELVEHAYLIRTGKQHKVTLGPHVQTVHRKSMPRRDGKLTPEDILPPLIDVDFGIAGQKEAGCRVSTVSTNQ